MYSVSMVWYSALLAIFLLLQPAAAFAYLDPGTGSMILQGLVAAIAVAGERRVELEAPWRAARLEAEFFQIKPRLGGRSVVAFHAMPIKERKH